MGLGTVILLFLGGYAVADIVLHYVIKKPRDTSQPAVVTHAHLSTVPHVRHNTLHQLRKGGKISANHLHVGTGKKGVTG